MKLLLNIAKNDTFSKDTNKYVESFFSDLKKCDFYKNARAKQVLDPIESSAFYETCIQALEERFLPHLNSYSSMRWLFYFRRLPNEIFKGTLHSVASNARALIEVYASQSKKEELVSSSPYGYVYAVDEATLRHIARFVAFVDVIYDLQVGYRFSNKGLVHRFSPREALPIRERDVEKEKAIALYDKRHDQNQTFLDAIMPRSGLAAKALKKSDDETSNHFFPIWFLVRDEVPVSPKEFLDPNTYPEFFSAYAGDAKMLAKYFASEMDLTAAFDLYRQPSMATYSISEKASLNLISLIIGDMMLATQPLSMFKTLELGYFIVTLEYLNECGSELYKKACIYIREHIPQFQAPGSFNEFIEKSKESAATPWPLVHGNPIRFTNSYVCIDVWGASMGFLSAMQFPPVQGAIANERAAKFEDIVQAAIEQTSWHPKEIRHFRQKTLRVKGVSLTDIDAMGVNGNTLLLVSCKSIPYTQEYDKGSFRVIRNSEATVDRAAEHWEKILETLRKNPTGDNFDFSHFTQIVGLVCTPFPVYTSQQSALRPCVDDLLTVSSLSELVKWLKRSE